VDCRSAECHQAESHGAKASGYKTGAKMQIVFGLLRPLSPLAFSLS